MADIKEASGGCRDNSDSSNSGDGSNGGDGNICDGSSSEMQE
jgi:hypothetical protein